jgi:hypothetical protein
MHSIFMHRNIRLTNLGAESLIQHIRLIPFRFCRNLNFSERTENRRLNESGRFVHPFIRGSLIHMFSHIREWLRQHILPLRLDSLVVCDSGENLDRKTTDSLIVTMMMSINQCNSLLTSSMPCIASVVVCGNLMYREKTT